MKNTVIKEAIQLLEQQKKSLQEMDLLGVLMESELAHKSSQIDTIKLLLAKLIPIEQEQISFALEAGMCLNNSSNRYVSDIESEKYYSQTFDVKAKCPKCHDRAWLYDDNGQRKTCPCHYEW